MTRKALRKKKKATVCTCYQHSLRFRIMAHFHQNKPRYCVLAAFFVFFAADAAHYEMLHRAAEVTTLAILEAFFGRTFE